MAGRLDGDERPAVAFDSVAVGEDALWRIEKVMRGIEPARSAFRDEGRAADDRRAGALGELARRANDPCGCG